MQAQAGAHVKKATAGAVAAGQHVQARGLVQPAEQEAYIPNITVDRVGAISVVGQDDPVHLPGLLLPYPHTCRPCTTTTTCIALHCQPVCPETEPQYS